LFLLPSSSLLLLRIARVSKMNVAAPDGVKIYNLTTGKTLPSWLSDKKKKDLRKDEGTSDPIHTCSSCVSIAISLAVLLQPTANQHAGDH
jgi:hypothetical protein